MKTRRPTTPEALVHWIRSVLQEGLVLTEDVARYMDSAFGTQDVGAVLATAPDCETGPLLELLCFPDRKLQLRFESRWEGNVFSADDQRAVISQLGRAPLSAVIRSTAGEMLGSAEIPPFVLEAVVHRLKITWQPPPELSRVLALHHLAKHRPAVRVFLRNSRVPWHAGQIRLLERFLSKMHVESDGFETCLAFLISILSELAPGCGGRDFLIAKKSFYFKALCRSENFERRLRSSNMEILILQGARAAHGDPQAWRQGMRMIDTLCRALFGETQYFQRPESKILDLPDAPAQDQIQDAIHRLFSNSN